MNINTISLEELKQHPEKYAKQCTIDELLDGLNRCRQNNERKNAIIKILKMQQNEQPIINSKLDLCSLLKKFHTDKDSDAYQFKHILMEEWENSELRFKCFLLMSCTLLLEHKPLYYESWSLMLKDLNIDATDFDLLHRLKIELELDLKTTYHTDTEEYVDISSNQKMLDNLKSLLKNLS